MIKLSGLTDYPAQKFTLIGESKEQIGFSFRYMASQNLWKIDVSYGDFEAKGIILVCSPNLLRQWRNILPFGLMVASVDTLDPIYLNDFTEGRVSVYLLNLQEVADFERVFE
jgi:hypothetical protein